MGEYFQIQDDYLDNFADPSILGKIGTDIQVRCPGMPDDLSCGPCADGSKDNKCSWLVNVALKKCSPEQRQVLELNYGQKDEKCEAKVKQLFDDLRLEDDYKSYEEARVKELREKISAVDSSEGLKASIFDEFLRKIYKRSK